jgi:class 3 adenylate cyclase
MGTERFIWDVYSDAVNTASRMQSYGDVGTVHVSEYFVREIEKHAQAGEFKEFCFEDRGMLDIKGKGLMHTYNLRRNTAIQ